MHVLQEGILKIAEKSVLPQKSGAGCRKSGVLTGAALQIDRKSRKKGKRPGLAARAMGIPWFGTWEEGDYGVVSVG